MNNYWLSEYKSKDQENDDETPDQQDNQDPQSQLNERQALMYDHYEHVVEVFGKFDKSSGPNGAHYAPAKQNPFKKEGLMCQHCVYYEDGGNCEIVSGKIESDAICKLWIIPEHLLD